MFDYDWLKTKIKPLPSLRELQADQAADDAERHVLERHLQNAPSIPARYFDRLLHLERIMARRAIVIDQYGK